MNNCKIQLTYTNVNKKSYNTITRRETLALATHLNKQGWDVANFGSAAACCKVGPAWVRIEFLS